jgi:hypothetical protein
MAELHFILGQDVFPRLISDVAYKLNVIQNYIQRQSKTSEKKEIAKFYKFLCYYSIIHTRIFPSFFYAKPLNNSSDP